MSKKKLPWFPCYPDDWLDDTCAMTDTQARVYWDFLCLLYIHEEDGALCGLRATNKWIAMELHVHINKWMAVRKFLVACGKLIANTDGSLTNNKAAKVCLERKARSEANATVADERESERRTYREQNPRLDLGDSPRHRSNLRVVGGTAQADPPGLPPPVTPPSNQGGLPPPVTGVGCKAISFVDQGAAEHDLAPHLNHHTKNNVAEKSLSSANASLVDDDDPYRRRRELSPALLAALRKRVGLEQAAHTLWVYFTSTYARDAIVIDKAFPAWVAEVYKERITEELSNKEIAAEILAMLPKGPDGKPDTALPKRVRG